jgi:predicted RNase H-like nuclease (RuvC/YqgF family)
MADYFEKYVAMCHIVENLKKEYSKSELKKKISEKDVEIGKLKSEIDELRYKNHQRLTKVYSTMNPTQKRNFKKSYKEVFITNQRKEIKELKDKLKELSSHDKL